MNKMTLVIAAGIALLGFAGQSSASFLGKLTGVKDLSRLRGEVQAARVPATVAVPAEPIPAPPPIPVLEIVNDDDRATLMAHFIGDIHQPLHVGTAYIDSDDAFVIPQSQSEIDDGTVFETRGDNNLLIGSRALHSYWDGQAVTYAMRRAQATSPSDFAAYLISHQTGIQSTAGTVADWPAAWATDTLAESQKAHRNLDIGEAEDVDDRNSNTHSVWPVTTPSNYVRRPLQRSRLRN